MSIGFGQDLRWVGQTDAFHEAGARRVRATRRHWGAQPDDGALPLIVTVWDDRMIEEDRVGFAYVENNTGGLQDGFNALKVGDTVTVIAKRRGDRKCAVWPTLWRVFGKSAAIEGRTNATGVMALIETVIPRSKG